jgi:hypothetical protein
MPTDDQWLTTDEVLDYLHLNLKTVYRLIKAGKLPGWARAPASNPKRPWPCARACSSWTTRKPCAN